MTNSEAAALIEQYEPLCWRLANQYGRNLPPHEREELAAAARLRLVESARTFDPAKGLKFMTYAYKFARWAVLAERQQLATRGVHVPANYDPDRVIPQVTNDFELSEGGDTVLDLVAAREEDDQPEFPADFWERVQKCLPPREWRCLTMRYQDGFTYDEIGRRIAVSKERVRQLLGAAVERLRRGGVFDGLKEVA